MRWAALVLVGCAAQAQAPRAPPALPPTSATTIVDHANEAIDALVANDWPAVVADFELDAEPPTPSQVEAAWHAQADGLGEARGWTLSDRTFQDGLEVRIIHVELERGLLQLLVSVDLDTRKLRSLFITRPAPAPAYIDRDRFREVDVTVGSAPYALPGTLTLPRGNGPFPAMLLVHGSGPNDRDESVGATKIFRDLAQGLASSGIAVLRYDKRTYTYRDQLSNNITLDEEAVDDAIAAVKLLAARSDIDPARIFVLGHSLGGLLAPEIAVRAGAVAGIALLSPPGRAPWEIVRDQMRYLGAPRDVLVKSETAAIELSLGVEDGFLAGMPYSYWRDWASRDGVAMVKRFARPTLVMHGTRDYQVSDGDFETWHDGLAKESYVELVTLEGVNHLFVAGKGAPSPLEYRVETHVDARVVAKLVAFVRAR
ncbi:MAG TPA: alpha/beta fold hydrolase [Kofleriaceae bacterium]|nr:alpha/beta fold hydrolase [Kofleriaceae bacterium]